MLSPLLFKEIWEVSQAVLTVMSRVLSLFRLTCNDVMLILSETRDLGREEDSEILEDRNAYHESHMYAEKEAGEEKQEDEKEGTMMSLRGGRLSLSQVPLNLSHTPRRKEKGPIHTLLLQGRAKGSKSQADKLICAKSSFSEGKRVFPVRYGN